MAEPKAQPALSQPILALLQFLGKALLPASAEAKVAYHDPEGERVGRQIETQENPDYVQQLFQAVLAAAKARPETVNVYGPHSLTSRQFWDDPAAADIGGFYIPERKGINLSSYAMKPDIGPYVLSHELVHFLQDVQQPKIPQGLHVENYPYALLGTPGGYPTGEENPIDALVRERAQFEIEDPPYPRPSLQQLDDFYRTISPTLPASKTLASPYQSGKMTFPVLQR